MTCVESDVRHVEEAEWKRARNGGNATGRCTSIRVQGSFVRLVVTVHGGTKTRWRPSPFAVTLYCRPPAFLSRCGDDIIPIEFSLPGGGEGGGGEGGVLVHWRITHPSRPPPPSSVTVTPLLSR